ncbi:MAG: ribosome maturation factor RimP [Desulfatiglandaceae bacterium]
MNPGNMRSEYIQSAVQTVIQLIEPVLEEMDVELVDVEYRFEQGRWVLRIYVDMQGGISVDDCARVSREIEDLIEINDIFQQEYVLEVSSPGLNRPLKKEKDFIRVKGEKIKVRMRRPLKGRRNFTGYLIAVKDGSAYLDVTEGRVALPLDGMEKANLVYDFGE